ncbi:hypothetical protein SAMN05192534_101305 [Alteribacillus persepolensis]|uniref:Uncharacterized protein n=1 Tax=Alteribacillus persepolensis TaxID=568899 RepID=A0A1G7YXF3_9BACI|nr:hypothetical protein [Alteribacillus persepolensis]SDH00929.1 hypothetical protein SAMN05192534_101305 [Alteribacillus persepolensis]
MFTKLKQLSSEEWLILILFIVSIICLVLTVQLTSTEEGEGMSVHMLDEEHQDVVTYGWQKE